MGDVAVAVDKHFLHSLVRLDFFFCGKDLRPLVAYKIDIRVSVFVVKLIDSLPFEYMVVGSGLNRFQRIRRAHKVLLYRTRPFTLVEILLNQIDRVPCGPCAYFLIRIHTRVNVLVETKDTVLLFLRRVMVRFKRSLILFDIPLRRPGLSHKSIDPDKITMSRVYFITPFEELLFSIAITVAYDFLLRLYLSNNLRTDFLDPYLILAQLNLLRLLI